MKFIEWIVFIKNRYPIVHNAKLIKSINAYILKQVKFNLLPKMQNSYLLGILIVTKYY